MYYLRSGELSFRRVIVVFARDRRGILCPSLRDQDQCVSDFVSFGYLSALKI